MNQELRGKTFITKDFEETEELGEKFAKELTSGDTVCLFGELGSGKTTFTKGLAKGLGIKSRIISPTFVLLRTYHLTTNNQQPISNLYHLDLYRLENQKEIEGVGLSELLEDKKAVVLIEWAEKIESLLPRFRWNISFEYVGENERKIVIDKENL